MPNSSPIHSTSNFSVVIGKSQDPELNQQLVYKVVDIANGVVNLETTLLPNSIQACNELEDNYQNLINEQNASRALDDIEDTEEGQHGVH